MKEKLLRALSFLYSKLRWVWSSPIGLLSLLLIPIFKRLDWIEYKLPSRPDTFGLYRCKGALANGLQRMGWGGFTPGWVSFFWEDPTSYLIEHEVWHTGQLRLWGVLFLVVYPVGFGVGMVRAWKAYPWTGLVNFLFDAYSLNPFEIQAVEGARKKLGF